MKRFDVPITTQKTSALWEVPFLKKLQKIAKYDHKTHISDKRPRGANLDMGNLLDMSGKKQKMSFIVSFQLLDHYRAGKSLNIFAS